MGKGFPLDQLQVETYDERLQRQGEAYYGDSLARSLLHAGGGSGR